MRVHLYLHLFPLQRYRLRFVCWRARRCRVASRHRGVLTPRSARTWMVLEEVMSKSITSARERDASSDGSVPDNNDQSCLK